MSILSDRGKHQAPRTHKTAAQTVTASWVDWGDEIDVDGADDLGLMGILTKNNSTNIRVRVLAKTSSAGTLEAPLPLNVLSATKVTVVTAGYIEFGTTDAAQHFIISAEVMKLYPYAQVQIQAGTVGVTGATFSASEYSLGIRG